ncbi:hypothetical protein LRD69_10380 [Streptomyces sp. JH14]|uniref:hypothetical protein n=1 Tax=Streptomyces sp. JH14 TaxID=2793630 RepID=UPI0023F96035|nr:hypothetical protein [Streptomyces sp. JH14]MDF6042558.1 hypothetical protein [Streptomyces sp. JH14]
MTARDADGNVHGYQFKEIQNPKKVVTKIFDNMKQLDESGADFRTARSPLNRCLPKTG